MLQDKLSEQDIDQLDRNEISFARILLATACPGSHGVPVPS
jgi:hypothetical protein